MENIKVEVNYNYSDYRNQIFDYNNKLHNSWMVIPCLFIFVLGTSYYGITHEFSIKVTGALITYSFILVLFLYIWYLGPYNAYKKSESLKHKYCFDFSTDFIFIGTEFKETKCNWSFFKKIFETKRMFFFYYEKNEFMILPKRCFENNEDIYRLVELIQSIEGLRYKKV